MFDSYRLSTRIRGVDYNYDLQNSSEFTLAGIHKPIGISENEWYIALGELKLAMASPNIKSEPDKTDLIMEWKKKYNLLSS